jgi:cephalosporin hydroxylase
VLREIKPKYVLYHGDTMSAAIASIGSSKFLNPFKEWKNIHLEAGLRSGSLFEPLPEEISRRICDSFSDILIAVSDRSKNNLIRENQKGKIVEIGSFKGKSTIWLAKGSQRLGREKVYAIDTHLGSPEHRIGGTHASHMPAEGTTEFIFRQNIKDAGLEENVVPLVMSSADALRSWQDPVRLLFIDAEHTYEEVRNDFASWEKYVVPRGLVVFHDVDRIEDYPGKVLDGPTKVVYEDVTQAGLFSAPLFVNHLAFVSKLRIAPTLAALTKSPTVE